MAFLRTCVRQTTFMQLSQGYIYISEGIGRFYFPTQQTNSIGKTENEGRKGEKGQKKGTGK